MLGGKVETHVQRESPEGATVAQVGDGKASKKKQPSKEGELSEEATDSAHQKISGDGDVEG